MSAVIGIDPTAVDSSDLHGVGAYGTPDGENFYVYVKANEAMADGEVATYDSAFLAKLVDTTETAPGTGQGKAVGVARATLAANEYGWLQVRGTGNVQVNASCAAYTELNATSTGGQIDDDATAGAEAIAGIVIDSTAGGSAGVVNGTIAYPYVGRTL